MRGCPWFVVVFCAWYVLYESTRMPHHAVCDVSESRLLGTHAVTVVCCIV